MPHALTILLNVVAVVDPAGTVTVLETPLFWAQKLEAVATLGEPMTRSKPPRALVPASADSNDVTLVLYWNRSFGMDAILLLPLNTDLKLVTSTQGVKKP